MTMARAALPLALTLFLAACGGGTPPPVEPPPVVDPPPTTADLTGVWHGTTTTEGYGTEQTTFTFTQTGKQVTGTLSVTESETFETSVAGTVDDASATITAAFSLEDEGTVTYLYQGTVTDTIFSGTVTLNFSDGTQDTGQFSVTKGAAVPTPPTDPTPPTNPPTTDRRTLLW